MARLAGTKMPLPAFPPIAPQDASEQVQPSDCQERHSERDQQRPVEIALWLVWGGHREPRLPARAPRQSRCKHDGEAIPKGPSGHEKVEMGILIKERNPLNREVQASGIENKQDGELPSLAFQQPSRLCVFHMQMQKERGQ